MQPNLALLKDFNQTIFQEKRSALLDRLTAHWQRNNPLKGIKILHNTPLTYETLVKLESLIAAGAELTVTHTAFTPVPPEEKILSTLRQAGINVILSHRDVQDDFDIALDCCAETLEMEKVRVLRGIVELTQTGGEKYKRMSLDLPIINVDDSNLKKLEGMYGTGESFVRAIKEITGEEIVNKSFVIFGFGKVGKGIVRYLLRETPHISVIESSQIQLNQAKKLGLITIPFSDAAQIRNHLREAFCIVTATGKANVLSQVVTQSDCQSAYIANMGTYDEIGDQIQTKKILCNKIAINFSLKHPTLLNYIDPVFYAHNVAAQLLLENQYENKYYPFPSYLDDLIIDLWKTQNCVDINDIYD
ncbi:NAD(P)-dependent oxidoreductase [Legionella micdadei]|uniref:Adenosylhomocysteinase n=1 Tax=Legionella micdadei TaxID=451 RepID=A0A098GE07_LEGMI|nr:NAD(P)-dependent oxidoreductase [Legionella micdadei]KTD30036.1 adenosylhomocysteinase [Legionella micdadei]NSL18585.1 NAD-binding protein [Legionella micdadei]CEG60227.1 Adenosylhomocysteinase [Legionella micdadei]SCY58278.1 adenosylhomocysteinase [Legionella micdadei]